jgi:dihydrofolate synthase / folylpolyglutamate synthase
MRMKENKYNNCLKDMYGLRRFGIKLGLSTIRRILENLENPQDNTCLIHVAGTNGKGSIASGISSILHAAGYKVGLYTSPHLIRFNERICINNRQISDENVVLAYEAVKNVHYGSREPTFFEFATAMALYEFGKRKTDFAVIETGMGGRLDATNIINPVMTIISNISIEHKMYLGNTIAQIAGEKAGIIKERIPVVTGVKQKSAIAAIKKISEEKSAPMYQFGNAFRVRKSQNKDSEFTYSGIQNVWKNMRTALPGNHQIENAALCLAACELLSGTQSLHIREDAMRNGLEQNKWPGRLEIVSKSPFVILDGAHNLVAANKLSRFLEQNHKNRNITLVVGILDDKPYQAMLKIMVRGCKQVILTCPSIDRALSPETLYPVVKPLVSDIKIIHDVGEALKHAVQTAGADDVVCAAGSLYVIGEAKQWLEKNPLS